MHQTQIAGNIVKNISEQVDVVIAGGGTAGHVAALQAARAGVKTSVIEAGSMLGGIMTAGGVYMPNHFYNTRGAVVLGIAWELYSKSKDIEGLPVPDYAKRRPIETPGIIPILMCPFIRLLLSLLEILKLQSFQTLIYKQLK